MEIGEGKILILKAFCELAWANGKIIQAEADFISDMAEQMDLPLGKWLPVLITGLSRPPTGQVGELSAVPIDEVERFQVVERFVALCLLGDGLSARQAEVLAKLALQLGINAVELEEMRRKLC